MELSLFPLRLNVLLWDFGRTHVVTGAAAAPECGAHSSDCIQVGDRFIFSGLLESHTPVHALTLGSSCSGAVVGGWCAERPGPQRPLAQDFSSA